MSERSKRRAAEVAVINAAVRFINWEDEDRPHPWTREASGVELHHGLQVAVREYNAIGLDATTQPALGHNTTDTSIEAGQSMKPLVAGLAKQCFDEIAAIERNGGIGLTVDQLEQILHRPHQSVSARVNGLRDKGWVVDSGQKRQTRSGRKAIVWTPTEMSRR